MEKNKQQLLEKTFHQFMKTGLEGDNPRLIKKLVDERVMGFGTAIDEKVIGREGLMKLIETQKKQAEGLDISWRHEPMDRFISDDENTAVFADDIFLIVKTESEEVEMYMRFSTVLNYSNTEWKVIHWHGSKPEEVESDKDTWGIENWKQKAEELERLVAEKTADLVEKNRELEIEAALERVRARALAMHSPEELPEVALELRKQMGLLGQEELEVCVIHLYEEDENYFESWGAMRAPGEEGKIFQGLAKFPNSGIAIVDEMMAHYHAGDKDYILVNEGEKAQEWFEVLKKYSPEIYQVLSKTIENIPTDQLKAYWAIADFEGGSLCMVTYSEPDPDSLKLLRQSANVFQLAYRRYRDLQKAEEQAREAQVEAALERVRAQTMAMHNSEDVGKSVVKMFSELTSLGVDEGTRFGIGILNHDNENNQLWTARKNGNEVNMHIGNIDMASHPMLKQARQAWKKQVSLHKYVLEGEDLLDYYKMLNNAPDYKIQIPLERLPKIEIQHCFIFEHGFFYAFSPREFTPELIQITKRFSALFEQTYRRYLDLVRAEAQAREAQIEAALEKVRSRSLAMHKSDELKEVVSVLFEKLKDLQIPFTAVGIATGIEGSKDLNAFVCGQNDVGLVITNYRLPYFDNPVPKDLYGALEKQLDFYVGHYSKEEKDAFYNYVIEHTAEFRHLPEDIKRMIFESTIYTISMVAVKNAVFNVNDFEGKVLAKEEVDIIQRFARVFDQAYTRFLDLQKAESQAREAQIEASLERVRAASMAMHKTDELSEVIIVLFKQFELLNLVVDTCFIDIFDQNNQGFNFWIGTGTAIYPKQVTLPYFDHPIHQLNRDARKNGIDFFTFDEDKKSKEKYFEHFYLNAKGIAVPEERKQHIANGKGITGAAALGKYSGITMFNYQKIIYSNEENYILIRVNKVFQQTYTRFLDLQKAEAQAREAQIEAALERVRAQTMGMQSSEDLSRVASVMFDQMKQLGGDLFAFGIVLCDKDKDTVQQWHNLGNDGMLSPFSVPVDLDYIHRYRYDQWKSGNQLFSIEIPQEYISEHFELMFELPSVKTAMDEITGQGIKVEIPDWEIDYGASFSHGYLLVSSLKPFEEDYIFPRFAKVFEQAYTRFLDLQKAEAQAREAKIETALEKVRSRTMGMRSSEELPEVANMLFLEVQGLGVPAWSSGFNIIAQDGKSAAAWMSSEGVLQEPFKLRLFGESSFDEMGEFIKSKDTFMVQELGGNALIEHYDHMKSFPDLKPTFSAIEAQGLSLPTFQINHLCKFSNGFLLFITYEHVPDAHDIFRRFTKIFDQTYTRFLDLQKAEAQAKEARIEAALERVRSRTMGMQKAEELGEVAKVLFGEMNTLVDNLWTCGFVLCEKNLKEDEWWLSLTNGLIEPFSLPNVGDYAHETLYEGWEKGEAYRTVTLENEQLQEHYDWLMSIPIARQIFEDMEGSGIPRPNWQRLHAAYFKTGYLVIITEVPCEEEEIFKRFAQVFDLTYTRFLDLQKAEAQARESKIQAALERVRAQAMAMHHTEDLGVTIMTYYEQLDSLINSTIVRCGAGLLNKMNTIAEMSTASKKPDGEIYSVKGSIDMKGHPILEKTYQHWLNQKEYNVVLRGNEIRDYYQYISGQVAIENNDEGELHFCFPMFTEGSFYVVTSKAVPENELKVFRRFSSVLSLTYKRFNDLQKAEAQAREAEIQLALERVRARTMAMHKSDELSETAAVLFEQLQVLGNTPERINLGIFKEESGTIEWWITTQEGHQISTNFFTKFEDHFVFPTMLNAWKAKEKSTVITLSGFAVTDWVRYITQQIGMPVNPGLVKEKRIISCAFFSQGLIGTTTSEPLSPGIIHLLERFASVFEQAYTRFLDLQRAEKQARESQIEAALEKVRSRSLAMQSPDELIEVAQLLREEMGALGVEELETSSIYLHDEISGQTQCWFTIKNSEYPEKSVSDQFSLELQDTWVGRKMLDFYSSSEDRTSILMQGENRIEWIRYCEGKTDLFGTSNFYGETIPERTYHLYKFSNGYIGAAAPGEISPESWDLLRRATAVFSFAYTRFQDLQKAEASARAAMRQASLDRIRADISSMRHTDDLDRITPLIFKELTVLGVPFIRCGVFIIQEKQELVEAYLSSPEGNSLGVLRLPYQASELTFQTVKAWRKGEIYKQHWNKEDFIQWINQLMEQDQIQDSSTYQGTAAPPESLNLHFVPFTQGMLYVGAVNPLDDKELELVQALAKAFSIAYSRYEDFVKLEQAKAEVESAMTELKATQSQLVQQEKLASLGQLTAGIAHEIKNPLNFVNNFSEVSMELIEEAQEERSKSQESRDETLVDEILVDIKSNLEKVHEHGTRANSIVSSMLQHSRGSSGKMEASDLNALVKEYLNLAFHGMRAGKHPINVEILLELDPKVKNVQLIKEDFTRVLVNLANNAFDAMRQKTLEGPADYKPQLTARTRYENKNIVIEIKDNGPGIPNAIKDKILQPFFTTKKGTEGTGLGLSITNDIIKAHGGDLQVKSPPTGRAGLSSEEAGAEREGTTMIIQLPI